MKRRDFSLSAVTVAAATWGGCAALPITAHAQESEPKEGRDYLVLDKPAPVEAATGKIEVVEFFWYNCSHCNNFEPKLDAWAKTLPKDVVLRRTPVAFKPDFQSQQRLFYVIESMGILDEMHKKFFYAIHVEKQNLTTEKQITDWVDKQGINKVKFAESFNSFEIAEKARKATQLQQSYKVESVPSLGIAGRYFTSGTIAKSMERALAVTSYLVGVTRKSAASTGYGGKTK